MNRGFKMDYYINLINKQGEFAEDDDGTIELDLDIQTQIMCGCGQHHIDADKDPYKQHNEWAAKLYPKVESGVTNIASIDGVGISDDAHDTSPKYDFSGEEFEVTADIIRKTNKK